jgi:hypothetical protein
MSSIVYYNCLALPEELERLVWFFKEELEYKDNKKAHKWKMSNCRYEIKNINWGSPWSGGNLWIFDETYTEYDANLEFSYEEQKDIYIELLGDTLYDFEDGEKKRLTRQSRWIMSSVLYQIKKTVKEIGNLKNYKENLIQCSECGTMSELFYKHQVGDGDVFYDINIGKCCEKFY